MTKTQYDTINQIKLALEMDYFIDKKMTREFEEFLKELEVMKVMLENHTNKDK